MHLQVKISPTIIANLLLVVVACSLIMSIVSAALASVKTLIAWAITWGNSLNYGGGIEL